MSLLFWRKRGANPNNPDDEAAVPVSREDPLPVRLISDDEDEDTPQPISVKDLYLPPIAGQTILRLVQVPGIGTASAYADGDAFGTLITWNDVFRAEKSSGTIVGAFLIDLDDEGIQVDIPLFAESFTTTADNSAFAPSDTDLVNLRGVVSVSEFWNFSSNQFGQASNVGLWIKGNGPNLYTQAVIRGAANISAGAIPWLGLVVVPD